jgi:hypothetical protein
MTGFPTALQQQKCPMGGNVGAASARSEISALLQWLGTAVSCTLFEGRLWANSVEKLLLI